MSVEENVWSAGEAAVQKPSLMGAGEGSVEGGQTPDVLMLLSETFKDFVAHWVGYGLAGLGFFVVAFPVALALALVLGGVMVAGVVTGDPEAANLAILGAVGLLMLLVPVISAVIVLLQGSLYRAFWHHETEGEEIGFRSPFTRMFQDVLPMELGLFGTMGLTFVGTLMCYLPGLLVGVFAIFVLPAIAIHRLSVVEAFKLSFTHVKEHFVWHLAFWGINFVLVMIAGNLPIIGYLLVIPFQGAFLVKAYRHIFGDGDKPCGWQG